MIDRLINVRYSPMLALQYCHILLHLAVAGFHCFTSLLLWPLPAGKGALHIQVPGMVVAGLSDGLKDFLLQRGKIVVAVTEQSMLSLLCHGCIKPSRCYEPCLHGHKVAFDYSRVTNTNVFVSISVEKRHQ